MDRGMSADQFYASIGMERPKVSAGEKASITAILTRVMTFLGQTGRQPYTLLLPDGDQLDSIGLDTDHLDQDQLDGLVGWFLDLVLYGDVLSSEEAPKLEAGHKQELSTVAGSSLVFSCECDKLLVTDPWGVQGVVSNVLFRTPAVSLRSVDALIMLTAWNELILPNSA